jgi:hypothetical protein
MREVLTAVTARSSDEAIYLSFCGGVMDCFAERRAFA